MDGLNCMLGSGNPLTKSGLAIYQVSQSHVHLASVPYGGLRPTKPSAVQWACNANMENRSFYSSDGDFLLVPELGTMDVQTVGRAWRRPLRGLKQLRRSSAFYKCSPASACFCRPACA